MDTRTLLASFTALALLATLPTPVANADAGTRCQAVSNSCSFVCSAGDVIGGSGIHAGVSATCGGATTNCSGEPDCLGEPVVAAYSDVGTCTMTSGTGEYVDCFSLPSTTSTSCSASLDYAACAYVCGAGSTLDASATHTTPGGWPRVLSRCGGGEASCQSYSECEATGIADHDGAGICLDRTDNTQISCSASSGPAGGPPGVVLVTNPDGTCTAFVDLNGDGLQQPDEPGATVPCTAPGSVPLSTPGETVTQGVPGVTTPGVDSQSATTPPVVAPATCTLAQCTQPTTVNAVYTPPVPQVCVPLVVCVGPVGPQKVTNDQTVPAVCSVAGAACLPPTTILPAQTVTTPAIAPIVLTPPLTLTVSTTGFSGVVTPHAGETTTFGPVTVNVGPIPVTVCQDTCPIVVPPEAHGSASVTVTLLAGDVVVASQTVPVAV